VSLAVRRGEAVGLLGPNGAGKTTVFYMITGLIPADRGTITLDGVDITHLPMYQRARRGVGYLPQEASIFRGLTVEDNIRAVLELTVSDRAKREAKLRELLDEFHISHLRMLRLWRCLAASVAGSRSPERCRRAPLHAARRALRRD
jgi:lipopolysaccharide export system ATP-binding protein